MRRPLTQGVVGALETNAMEIGGMRAGSLEHQGADQVVGNQVYVQFAPNHRGSTATQHVH